MGARAWDEAPDAASSDLVLIAYLQLPAAAGQSEPPRERCGQRAHC